MWTQKSHISLWAQTQKGCGCALGVVLVSTQSLSQTLGTRWTFLFSCLEGSCETVRGKIRTKKKQHLKMRTALQQFGGFKLLETPIRVVAIPWVRKGMAWKALEHPPAQIRVLGGFNRR